MASSKGLKVEIISPSGILFEGYCHMAVIPATSGDLGIMKNHEVTLSRLQEGKINIYNKEEKITKTFDVKEGFAHNTLNKLLILLDKQ